ncbi:hypothetical protein [Cryobacterium arcticum]|nr:hypothetical protein [Cryobacterium arcticum]
MTRSARTPSDDDGLLGPQVSDIAVQGLADAIAQLGNDREYFVKALTDFLLAMKPIARGLTEDQVQFLIESGSFTAAEWAATSASVDRGGLQVSTAEEWLLDFLATTSLEDTADFLDWSDDRVRAAVANGQLYGIEVSGRLRFPRWQFNAPSGLLPGLPEIIASVTPRWHWQSTAGFMLSEQSELVGESRMTPVQWLRDGREVKNVINLVKASDWR